MIEIDDCEAVFETERAICCYIYGEEVYVPKSVILEESEVQGEGDYGILVVTEWFAEKEGLI